MSSKGFLPFVCAALASSISVAQQAQTPGVLEIDASAKGRPVSPILYGLMTEEINHSYDGGLYGELVQNRSFHKGWDEPAHWFLSQFGSSKASMRMDDSTSPTTNRKLVLRLTVEQASPEEQAGFKNEGYWGIPVRPNTTYRASFYAKSESASIGAVTVSLVNNNSGQVKAKAISSPLTTEWKKYDLQLETQGGFDAGLANHLLFTLGAKGTVWFDMFSLFPPTYKSRENGNRIDLMEKLAALKPAFLRFPGGNYLEGDHMSERYEWKKTIGPLVDRPTHPSPWHYHSSDGMGLLEFLEWCEDLNMQPVLAVYAGYSMMQEHTDPGQKLEPYVQEALDEIEYVTGAAASKWGAVRAKGGHPEPFKLNFVEVGNEDMFDKSQSYSGRYHQFYDAIKSRYPHLQIIATAPVTGKQPDVLDDHYYKRADEFFDFVHHYDNVDRNGPKIFVGEWATREGTPTPNFGAALGDAAWMTAMERNSDLIIMASYAPLLVNVSPGAMQWDSNLIGYDALTSYGSPSYYAQVLFSNHIGNEILPVKVSGGGPRVFCSATRNAANGLMFVKVVNASSTAQPMTIQLNGSKGLLAGEGKVYQLTARTTSETNTLEDPTRITPQEKDITSVAAHFQYLFAPYSINILELRGR